MKKVRNFVIYLYYLAKAKIVFLTKIIAIF